MCPACVYLNGICWWGKEIKVKPSTAKHVKMAREGVEVSGLIILQFNLLHCLIYLLLFNIFMLLIYTR